MNTTLKILSILLAYPDETMHRALPEIRQAIAGLDGAGPAQRKLLDVLASDIEALDLFEAQERYVYLFDRTRTLSLHLFEHVHGESRDRGQAMVDLMAMYEADGLEIDAKE